MNYYEIYSAKTGELLARGNAKECSRKLRCASLNLISSVDVTVPTGGSVVIDTGIHVNLPAVEVGGFFKWSAGLLPSKSGLNVKLGIISDGTIDAEYTGSIRVKPYNLSDADYQICCGYKITRLVTIPSCPPSL